MRPGRKSTGKGGGFHASFCSGSAYPRSGARRLRSQESARAVGFCYSFSRLSTAVTSILIGIILQYAGTPGVISFIVVSMLMVMLSVGIFGPRTRGIRLENI